MGYISDMRAKIGLDRLIAAGSGSIVYQDGQILLQKRRDNGFWGIHGGCVEVGERTEDTAKRELLEETGLIAESLELFGVYSGEDMLYTYPNGDMIYYVNIVYICRKFSGDMLTSTDETTDLQWFDVTGLPENLNPSDKRAILDFVRSVGGANRA